ncbi:MAG: hypothetical protein U1F50_01340 [Rubrivivax sp.]
MRQRQRHHHGVAVGRGLGDEVGGDDAAGPRLGVDDDGLAPACLQLLAVAARQGVDRAAGGAEGHQADRLAGEGGGLRAQRRGGQGREREGRASTVDHREVSVVATAVCRQAAGAGTGIFTDPGVRKARRG